MKTQFRIYALIIGPVLTEGSFMNCSILKMDFDKQSKRGFLPLQGSFSDDIVSGYETYATFLPFVDPMLLKSKYVIYYDSYESEENSAIGDAVHTIEKACRYLSIAETQDIKSSIGYSQASFHPYLYQIVKIYKLGEKQNEIEIDYKIKNYSVTLLRKPENNNWKNASTIDFINGISGFHNDTLERALKYLYRSSIGLMILDSPEKRALDHFKAIEIIINSLSNKREFSSRLNESKLLLGLSDEEVKTILQLWDDRSTYGDIAHPSVLDHVERYPNQFPIPSNVQYSGFLDSTPGRLILRYYEYIKNVYTISIETNFSSSMEDNFAVVNPNIESNHYIIFTEETDKTKLKNKIKAALSNELGIDISKIVDYKLLPQKVTAIIKIET